MTAQSQTRQEATGTIVPLTERPRRKQPAKDVLPIGAVLRELRGDRSLRDVQRETGITNSYLCNVERGSQQPGLKFLGRVAEYYRTTVADIIRQAESLRDNLMDTDEARIADVEHHYRLIMKDPRMEHCPEPGTPLSTEAKRHMVRMYEVLTGRALID